jgi:hypothetical protein
LLTFLGLTKKYLMAPISNKKLSLQKQWKNLIATFIEKRNHPGLTNQNN